MRYLYNEIEAPELPWPDGIVFKYALVIKHAYNGSIGLYLTQEPMVRSYSAEAQGSGFHWKTPYWFYMLKDTGEWSNGLFDESGIGSVSYLHAHWSNHDIINADKNGEVFLAARYPIDAETGEEITQYGLYHFPVTPAKPINPTAMLMGWLVGRRIAGQRGNVVQPEQPSGVYDDAFPIEWNILGTGGNAGFTLDGENFVKVSNLAPSSLANMSVSAQYQGQTFDFVMTEAENNDSFAGSATWSLAYFYCEEMDITLKMHSLSAGFTLGAWVVPEAGLYVTDFSAIGLSVDVTIEETV